MRSLETPVKIPRIGPWSKRIRLLLFFISVLILSTTVHAQPATVVVDASNGLLSLENIAGGINFWGQQEAQERFMAEIGTGFYRIKANLSLVHKYGPKYTNFRLEGADLATVNVLIQNANLARAMGCKIVVQILGMPKWLSTSQDERVVTNGMPNYAKYPPTDYDEWARVVYNALDALGRAGLQGVDYYEIFGEPNVGSTWYQQTMPCKQDGRIVRLCEPNELGHNTVEVMENFLKVYKYTAIGITGYDSGASAGKIGGPAILPDLSGMLWTRFIAKNCNLYALPLDFYSWHWFLIDDSLSTRLSQIQPHKPLTIEKVHGYFNNRLKGQGFSVAQRAVIINDYYNYLKDLEQLDQQAVRLPYSFVSTQLSRILEEEGYIDLQLFLTEWNVGRVRDRRRDTHYGASFVTRGLIDITDSGTHAQALYYLSSNKLILGDNGFGGSHSIFTLDGNDVPKASFNAFKLFSMLGDGVQRVQVDVSDYDIYAIATKDENEVSVLATYYVMAQDPRNPDYGLSRSVSISIGNIPFSQYEYQVYLIDGDHSNSFYGSGPELEVVDSGTGSGDFEKVMDLSIYGVTMVKVNEAI